MSSLLSSWVQKNSKGDTYPPSQLLNPLPSLLGRVYPPQPCRPQLSWLCLAFQGSCALPAPKQLLTQSCDHTVTFCTISSGRAVGTALFSRCSMIKIILNFHVHFSCTFTETTLPFFHLPGEIHRAKVCSDLFITKLHLLCCHLAPSFGCNSRKTGPH